MSEKRKKFLVAGVILIIIGVIALIYAQNEIDSNWMYSWSEPYSDFESRIITIKYVGIGSLVLGAISTIVHFFSTPSSDNNDKENK